MGKVMEIITLSGTVLDVLLSRIEARDGHPHTVRVALDSDGVKVKVNGGDWSPGYPVDAEDVQRRQQADPRSVYAAQPSCWPSSIDGLHAFEREEDRDAYVALYDDDEKEPLTIRVMGQRQAELFLAEEAAALEDEDGDTDEINAGTHDEATLATVDREMWGE